jgi:hypothetical protein
MRLVQPLAGACNILGWWQVVGKGKVVAKSRLEEFAAANERFHKGAAQRRQSLVVATGGVEMWKVIKARREQEQRPPSSQRREVARKPGFQGTVREPKTPRYVRAGH